MSHQRLEILSVSCVCGCVCYGLFSEFWIDLPQDRVKITVDFIDDNPSANVTTAEADNHPEVIPSAAAAGEVHLMPSSTSDSSFQETVNQENLIVLNHPFHSIMHFSIILLLPLPSLVYKIQILQDIVEDISIPLMPDNPSLFPAIIVKKINITPEREFSPLIFYLSVDPHHIKLVLPNSMILHNDPSIDLLDGNILLLHFSLGLL